MTSAERRRLMAMENIEQVREYVARTRARGPKLPNPRAPGRSRDERREERNERMAAIRELVMARADGRCEWCQREGFVLEWAHVIDGNGNKRAHEAVDTTAGICADCHHRGWHGYGGSRAMALRAAKEWAIRLGFREALAAIEKKIAKVEEARRTPSVPVRIEVES